MASKEIKGVISPEVINFLVSLMKEIIGENAIKVIIANSRKNVSKDLEGREILFRFATELQKTLGKNGAFATMRQVGRDLAKYLMKEYSREEWDEVLANALNDFGFARKIEKDKNRAYICNCVFYEILENNNLGPIEHAICWAGWGFIEGFIKEMEGAKCIKWIERDYEKEMCRFDFIKDGEICNGNF
ncbi:MAG: hypothetical protein DSY53_04735 [Persephonella sp.]|nr:MAG: hypothetical protein DSY53_04735 [Persephonella sp.]